MEIVSTNDGLLLDVDAYRLLKERVRQRKANGGGKQALKGQGDARLQKSLARNRDWVERECIKHLQEQPAASVSPQAVKSFLAALKRFSQERGPQAELTLAETLQLVNLRPTAPVEVHLAVEECAERLTDEDVDALCELVAAHLGGGEASGEAEAAAATVEGGAMEVAAADNADAAAATAGEGEG